MKTQLFDFRKSTTSADFSFLVSFVRRGGGGG